MVSSACSSNTPSPPFCGRTQDQGRLRVLIVDDDADAGESLMMLLEVFGHQVRVARDGPTALELACEDIPELMLVDIGLPGMDGCELARRARRMRELRDVVLVAFTGYGRDEDHRRTLGAGFDHHLTKPVDPALLRELLRSLVSTIGAAPAAMGQGRNRTGVPGFTKPATVVASQLVSRTQPCEVVRPIVRGP